MWYVYIVECSDGTLYTGVTRDIEARMAEHNSGEGAKYTRPRRPVRLVYVEEADDRSSACKREYAIKKFSRQRKLSLVFRSNDVL